MLQSTPTEMPSVGRSAPSHAFRRRDATGPAVGLLGRLAVIARPAPQRPSLRNKEPPAAARLDPKAVAAKIAFDRNGSSERLRLITSACVTACGP